MTTCCRKARREYYEEFIAMYPHDPLSDRIRWLLRNLTMAQAWHKAVLANSPFAYKTFADNYANSPYAPVAWKLYAQPKAVPLMQATHLMAPAQLAPNLKPGNFGLPKEGTIKLGDTVAPIQGGKLGIALGDKPKLDNTVGIGRRQPAHGKTDGGKIVTAAGIGPKTDRRLRQEDRHAACAECRHQSWQYRHSRQHRHQWRQDRHPAGERRSARSAPTRGEQDQRPEAGHQGTTFPAKRIVDAPVNRPKFQVALSGASR